MPKKVLLIEYEPRYIERIRTLLTPLGHALTEAHDGEAGLQAFGASKFDVVLLSGMLPRLPSAEVIREIRKKGGATAPPILLMMSGYRGTNRKADAQKVGAFDILARPFNDEDLVGSVKDALDVVGHRRQDHADRHHSARGGRVASDVERHFFGRALGSEGGRRIAAAGRAPARGHAPSGRDSVRLRLRPLRPHRPRPRNRWRARARWTSACATRSPA